MNFSKLDLDQGKVQQKTLKRTHLFTIKIELYKENKTYHVRAFNYVNGSSSCDCLTKKNYKNINKAKRYFKFFSKNYEG